MSASHTIMDLLPLIPGRDGSQNAIRAIREAFQDTLDGRLYPKKVAEYIVNCHVDDDMKIKETADHVLQIYDGLNDVLETIENAGREIMEQQGSYLIRKDRINSLQDLKERIRLQHCYLFKNLRLFYVDYFGLLQKSDLLPDVIKKYLDYRINESLHLCKDCLEKMNRIETVTIPERVKKLSCEDLRKRFNQRQLNAATKESIPGETSEETFDEIGKQTFMGRIIARSPYIVIPNEVEFMNCEPGKVYKRTVKLINTSGCTQYLMVKDLPKSKDFSLVMTHSSKLAAGMNCSAKVVYKPKVYRNIHDHVSFRNQEGFTKRLMVKAIRDPPKLITCIFRPNGCYIDRPKPGSLRFLETRREALNSSIDCGSCLVGEYIYLSVFVQNMGNRGKFFIITEDEWYSENIETITTSMEYSNDALWIYPTFFELNNKDTTEISVLFFPSKADIYLEKFYFICDNNSFQQFEVLGDGLMFNSDMLKVDVPPNDVAVNKKEDYCVFFGTHPSNTCIPFTLTVHNTSSIVFKGYWKFENKTHKDFTETDSTLDLKGYWKLRNITDIYEIDPSWIECGSAVSCLAPYSTTDYLFNINLNSSIEGCYNIFFNFILADIPLMSLDREGKFLVFSKPSTQQLNKCVDLRFMEMEVACTIENFVEEEESLTSESTMSVEPFVRPPKVQFSCYIMEFGILPNGLRVQKEFWVESLCPERTRWKIVEVRYDTDSPPYMEIVKKKNVTCDFGEFSCPCKKQKIFYQISERGPVSRVSMLLLISLDEETAFEIEALCIVTYEIIDYLITINDEPVSPVLFPMKALYTGVSETLKISVVNHSPITGMFYFLPPYGESTSYVDVEITPIQGVLKPRRSKTVEVKITCNEVGIFENVYVPCFINKGQRCIIVRVLCAVDSVHVAVYLPGKSNHYQRIMWPPKILFEYDDNWIICPCTLEYAPDLEMDETNFDMPKSDSLQRDSTNLNLKPGDNTPVPIPSVVEITTEENLSNVKSTSKQSSSSSTSEEITGNLKEILQEQFGSELFLQDYVVEVQKVPLRTPTNISFYLENITPVQTSYTVEATNFYTTIKYNKLAEKLNFKKPVNIWNDMIMNRYGILVLPDLKEGDLDGAGFAEINLTIFANTWGIYQEEIAVDITDVPCFTFSLLIEVVGCPVEVPMASSKITELPVIRFGNVPYGSEDIPRKLKISNTSSIPLKVFWHLFLKTSSVKEFNVIFDITSKEDLINAFTTLTDKYYGKESNNLFTISSHELKLECNSSDFMDLTMTPQNADYVAGEKTPVQCTILGNIFLEDQYRMKTNYYFRPTEIVRLEIESSLELPLLTPDFSGETTMRFYANEVIFDPYFKDSTRLVFINNYNCAAEVQVDIDEPMEIINDEGVKERNRVYVVEPLSCMEVKVICNLSHQKILDLSELVYPKKDINTLLLMTEMDVQNVDEDLKILHLIRDFKVIQKGGIEQVFPINVFVYYPCISTKPNVVRLDQVLLGNTRKALVTVFNHTGCPISFEIYKTMATEELFVTPHYGVIHRSTGVNKSFVNLFIYFTPREVKQYQESIRVVTNIPNYYIEVTIKATGTLNEKLYVDYKI